MISFNALIQELIKSRVKTPADLSFFKRKVAKKYKIPCPSNFLLLKAYHKITVKESIKNSKKMNYPAPWGGVSLRQLAEGEFFRRRITAAEIEELLKTRPVRSLSGIVNVSVLTKPYPCPGKCIYCPLEKNIPKSYLSGEPAVERAKKLKYSPYSQVKKRIEMLKAEGHPTDKIELRIIGGTWSYYPKQYQNWFIKECFRACNKKSKVKSQKSKLKCKIQNLKREQKKNEKAKHRIVGLSIETRPDFINPSEIQWLRELGVTMVELGVQNLYDDVLEKNIRGHGVKEIISATKLLKNAGFKALYQMMPNLPGSNLKKDQKMFEELFQNQDFKPDLLKIYPCALLKEAPLYNLWKQGKYKPYTEKQLTDLIKSIKKEIPYYVRIQRISRDIPSQLIIKGPAKISNLRQILAENIKKEGWQCKCIRCREVKDKYNPKEKIFLFRINYSASGGKEIFLSFENKKRGKLYSLLRLRMPSPAFKKREHFLPVLQNSALIREVHTYGQQLSLSYGGHSSVISPQHKFLGKKLIREAEKIAKKEFRLKKIAVISAIGARNYFKKLGYKLKDTYMVKKI